MGYKDINGARVYYDGDNQNRWLDAIGENVVKFELETGTPTDDTTGYPTRFVTTVVDTGGGTTTVVNSETAGEKLLLTDAAAEYDGTCLTLRGEAFELAAGKPLYFGIKLKMSNVASDWVAGLMETLTQYFVANAHTLAVAAIDGVFFNHLNALTVIAASYENNTAEASAVVHATGDASYHIYEILWDGVYVSFYYDATLVTTTGVSVTTGALTPVLQFRNGGAAARTANVAWMRAFQVR